MHKLKTFLIITILAGILAISAYLGIIYGVPALINSQKLNNKIENIIEKKTGITLNIEDIKLFISPELTADISIKELSLPVEEKIAAGVQQLTAFLDLKTLSLQKLNTEKVFADAQLTRKILTNLKKDKNKKAFNLSKLPEISINQADIVLNPETGKSIDIRNIELKKINNNIKTLSFNAFYNMPEISQKFALGQEGQFYIKNDAIYADKFMLKTDESKLYLDGQVYAKDKSRNLSLKASNIPADETIKILLYYQKLKDKNKKFLENFKDFRGCLNFDLHLQNNNLSGILYAENLGANSVLFDVPVVFPKAEFILNNRILISKAEGLLGGEKVIHTLRIENIFSPERIVSGEVASTLTENVIEKYLPETYHLKNTADAKVLYKIQNKIPEVKYYLKLNKGSDIFYQNAYLGLRKQQRMLYARTVKVPDGLKLKEYEYYIIKPSENQTIIQGDGLFIKQNGKMTPKYITCRTNGYAPVSVTGSFGKYVHGGKFKGNLKYDFITDKITGDFEIARTIFNHFYVRSAKVAARLNGVDITADGHYKHQPFDCKMNIENRLDGLFIVRNMEILIEKFIIQPKTKKDVSSNPDLNKRRAEVMDKIDDVSSRINDIDMTINQWNIKVNELLFDDLVLNNIRLFGSLKESLFNFTMPEVFFADGGLSAEGRYDFNNNSSIIDFSAREINSNIAAEKLFNLVNQIQGTAQAKLHVHTYNNLQEIFAHVDFEMQDGYLPQLGNTEFMLGRANKKRRVNLYDLTNFDFARAEELNSDIKGSFDMYNYDLKNINITSHQKFMSLYINGQYNMFRQDAEMNIYGKYDKDAPKGIKILFVPLNWILKLVLRPEESMIIYKDELAKIPPIETKKGNTQYFRVSVKGNLNNTDDIRIILKRIKQ